MGMGMGVMWGRMIISVCVFANECLWYRVLDTQYNSAASAAGPHRRKLWPGEHPDG